MQRGRKVNKVNGEDWETLEERHDASDFDKLPAGPDKPEF